LCGKELEHSVKANLSDHVAMLDIELEAMKGQHVTIHCITWE